MVKIVKRQIPLSASVCVRVCELEQSVKRGAREEDGGDRQEGRIEARKGGSEGVSEHGRGRRSGFNTKTGGWWNRKELLAARVNGGWGKSGTELFIEEETKCEREKD